ncbi:MAG: HTH domain-containing protein [Planctomycetaceae bacterium]|nr:HTH domain-containing protein [Planctomycetaceae bacterium]
MRYEQSLAIAKRHSRLVALIRSGKYSSPSLAEALEVSEQTIYRDIEFLKAQGLRIGSVRRAKGWAYQLLNESSRVLSQKRSSPQ